MAEAKRSDYQRRPDASNPDAIMLNELKELKKQDAYKVYFDPT